MNSLKISLLEVTKELIIDYIIKNNYYYELLKNEIITDDFQKRIENILKKDSKISYIIVNAKTFKLIRKFAKGYFIPETLTTNLLCGYFGEYFGIGVWVRNQLTDNEILFYKKEEIKKDFPNILESEKHLIKE
jgi:hypothetical protein